MSTLLSRLKAASKNDAEVIKNSKFFQPKDFIPTNIYSLNIALSGDIEGGISPGLTVLAGESRHFKSALGLLMAAAFQQKHKDGIVLFYDSEFGVTPKYLESMGIDNDRVLHIPVTDLEEMRHDISQRINEIQKGDKVFIFFDSVGNIASKKEVEDALEGKSAADMTRAKVIKSLFRIVTPHLTIKEIPMVVVAHVYSTMELFSKTVISGGQSILLSANTAIIITRSQEKEGKDLQGYSFNLNVEKSRFVIEKSRVPLIVRFDNGINRYSGLLELALESGHVESPSKGWYQKKGATNKIRAKEMDGEFWNEIIGDEGFKEFIQNKYKLGYRADYSQRESNHD